jgi:acetolactate synthase-1/2/3 large subunit
VPTHAEVIAKTLAERGVPYVFGLPGGEIVAFIDACRRAGIRFLLTGHEASAAWMAQVTGQITGVPGVCASTLGPGATNLVTGVANALLDRAPMLAVTAQIPQSAIATMTHQRLDLHALFAPITKASISIEQNTGSKVAYAMELAAAPRPGPVHLSLASDVATQVSFSNSAASVVETKRDASARKIEERLAAARRPLVLIGLGATPAMKAPICFLIERLRVPFLVTPKAKGIVSEDHPLFLGVASGMAIDGDILETIRAADLLLAIGFDPVECDKTWFAKTEIVSIDSASMAEGDYRPVEAVGDIARLVGELRVEGKAWPEELIEKRRAAMRRKALGSTADGLSPLRAIEEMRAGFPRDGMVACDVGSHKLAMGQFWRSYEPGTFFMSNGLSGMGFGLPAAIAAQLAFPERAVMAVVGDGGMLMMMHDLTMIQELGLPIVTVVFVDRSLSLIRVSESRRGIEPYGVDFRPPDFVGVAEAFGIGARRLADIAELKGSVELGVLERKPVLIEVPIDPREYYELV